MKTKPALYTSLTLFCAVNIPAGAGTFKHITIDGSFGDWAGVPPALTQSTPGSTNDVVYKDIYVANDEDFLYIRFTLFSPADPFTSRQNIFVDTDNNLGTGFGAAGGRVGSEMLIQSGNGYQEKNGGFNEGGVDGLDWASGPAAPGTDFEMRISRHATYASDGQPVFTGDMIAFLLEAEDSGWNPVEFVPADPGGLAYTFEPAPSVLPGTLSLVGLSDTSWRVNASGIDLGSNWLDQAYDDTQSGWASGQGLFGFTATPAAYPSIQTPLQTGRNTYYFRTHFSWDYETANLAFVVTNYLSDGAVYYLNGAEVRRVRMPDGPVSYASSATGAAAPIGQVQVFGVPAGSLVQGDNILEVETHQAPDSATDMVLGLSLTAATQFPVLIVDSAQPADRTVVAGQSTTFSAEILGSGPLSYQWLKDGVPLPSQTAASLTIPVVLPGDAGSYALQVSNPLLTNTTRAAILTVTGSPVVLTDPSLPADQTVVEGGSITFQVAAAGSAPLLFQWFKGAEAIPDATNATYTIATVLPADAGSYHAQITNPVNTTNSRSAALAVTLDTTPPGLTAVQGTPSKVYVVFSEPVDPATASAAANYTLSGGLSVLSVSLDSTDPTRVTLTTSAQQLGSVYTLSVNHVQDRFGNPIAANSHKSFFSNVVVDGSFDDWKSLTPIYSGESGSPDATNPKDIYVFNDTDYIYFRITTWDPTVLTGPNNFFFDTDNDPTTGNGGAEMLIQGGSGYQEKNGGFNEGEVDNLGWLCLPAGTATDFEFRISRAAIYHSDGLPVFTTNVINFYIDAENSSWQSVNRAPAEGMLSYTLVEPPVTELAPLSITLSSGQVKVSWIGPGTLQSCGSLTSGSWTNLPSATSPYTVPASGPALYFRLTQ